MGAQVTACFFVFKVLEHHKVRGIVRFVYNRAFDVRKAACFAEIHAFLFTTQQIAIHHGVENRAVDDAIRDIIPIELPLFLCAWLRET